MATWHTGQAWRVVGSLNKLNEQIRAYAPRAVPPATDVNAWGSIADDAHTTSSDHYPHYYSALGSTAVVCARDFPHAPKLGLDGHVVTEVLRISRDPRIGYLICDRRITGPNHGWQWQAYTGSDPHDTHFHVSTVHDGRADQTQAWTLPGGTPAPVVIPPTTSGEATMIYTVTNVPAGAVDMLGSSVVNNSRCLATPNGVFSLNGGEVVGHDADFWADTITITWTRLGQLCTALRQPTVPSDTQWQALLDQVGPAAGNAVKDVFGPAFDTRVTAATRAGLDGATLHASS